MGMKLTAVALIILALLFFQPIVAATKVLLFISEQFPQIPIKPLHLLTMDPKHELVYFGQGIVADLYLPNRFGTRPTLIIAMGVRTNEKDKPILLGFADTLARLGYVVAWPRSQALDKEQIKYERPQTFIDTFKYLQTRPEVDKTGISYVGFSVGSSLAMVAAADLGINEQIHSLVFFGGYYNILDYLTSLYTASMVVGDQQISWQPQQSGLDHAKGILESEGIEPEQFISASLSKEDNNKLLQYSPDQNLENFKAAIFILHEKADNYVPFVESIKLKQVLADQVPTTFHLANLFEHVQPKKGISSDVIAEFAGLFVFLHKLFMYL